MPEVEIVIEYFGWYAEKAGKNSETLRVSSRLSEAYDTITGHVMQTYGMNPPYIMLLGNKHIQHVLKRQSNLVLNGNEVFKILPFLSGG